MLRNLQQSSDIRLTLVGHKLLGDLTHLVEQYVVEVIAEGHVSLEVLEELDHELNTTCFSFEQIDSQEGFQVEVSEDKGHEVPVQLHDLVEELDDCGPKLS